APEPEKPASRPTVEIRSPMIGTFYRSPNPDAPPLASVGDKVTKGQTVCIIEAMKLSNESESEVSGTIVKVIVENATPVEYDQPFYLLEVRDKRRTLDLNVQAVFRRILLASRGEIALGVIRTCSDMGLSTVAVCSPADREGLHVR